MRIALINPGPQRTPNKLGVDSKDSEVARLSDLSAIALEMEKIRRIEKFSLDLKPKNREYIVSLSLLSIASYIREKENANVDYIQYDYFEKLKKESNILKKLRDFDIVGITANTDNYYKVIKILKEIKRRNTDILTVIGGPHVTYQDTKAINDADIVVRGEGEEIFRQIVNAHAHSKGFENIKGITYKDNFGRIKRNPPLKLLNINDIPTPAFDLIPKHIVDNCLVYLSTSRGCPYRCAYCVECNFWKGVRYRSPDKIVEDINEFQKSIRTNELFFSDSTFNCNQKRLKTLAKLLKHFDLYYYANVRPDMLTHIPHL